jgi:hypothetical protein
MPRLEQGLVIEHPCWCSVEDVDGGAQKYPGKCFPFNMQCAIDTTLWFRHSTTPFCCGEYGAVSC